MKKFIISVLACTIISGWSFAQELTSKKGTPILPEKGDYALSIDAVPFFEYLGNMFHGDNKTSGPTWDFPNSMWTLQGKYFLESDKAIRGRIRIGYNSQTDKNLVVDQNVIRTIRTGTNTYKSPAVSFPLSTVQDKRTTSSLDIVLGAGLEKRRGKGRVQGVYGAMINVMLGSGSQKYTYGNSMDTGYYYIQTAGLVPDTSSISFRRGAITTTGSSFSSSDWTGNRILKSSDGFNFGIGANIFVGVEYFFAPKMSVGGEFSWGVMLDIQGKSKEKYEYVKENVTSSPYHRWHTVSTYELENAGSTFFGIDNNNTYGAINLTFYF